jgi:hypothetical protein
MLCVNSTFRREASWYLGNVALFLVLAFAMLIGIEIVLLGFSSDEAITRGRSGAFPEQVLESALAGMLYLFVWLAPPVLAVVLAVYRAIVTGIRHARGVAILLSAVFASVLVIMGARDSVGDERWIVLPAAGAFAYAAILRLPGRTLADLPPPVRGSVIGMSLSFVWFVGSVIAMAFAFREYGRGRRATAGWILAAGTVILATLFFGDLWRDGVPALNYPYEASFVIAAVIGLGHIAWSGAPALLAKYSARDS